MISMFFISANMFSSLYLNAICVLNIGSSLNSGNLIHICNHKGLTKISWNEDLKRLTNLANLISSLIIPSAAMLFSPPPSSYINLLYGIFETCFNLSEKYFKDSTSLISGPSPPKVSISGCSPSFEGNQYSLLN